MSRLWLGKFKLAIIGKVIRRLTDTKKWGKDEEFKETLRSQTDHKNYLR